MYSYSRHHEYDMVSLLWFPTLVMASQIAIQLSLGFEMSNLKARLTPQVL
jgi:hypothetical protein